MPQVLSILPAAGEHEASNKMQIDGVNTKAIQTKTNSTSQHLFKQLHFPTARLGPSLRLKTRRLVAFSGLEELRRWQALGLAGDGAPEWSVRAVRSGAFGSRRAGCCSGMCQVVLFFAGGR